MQQRDAAACRAACTVSRLLSSKLAGLFRVFTIVHHLVLARIGSSVSLRVRITLYHSPFEEFPKTHGSRAPPRGRMQDRPRRSCFRHQNSTKSFDVNFRLYLVSRKCMFITENSILLCQLFEGSKRAIGTGKG